MSRSILIRGARQLITLHGPTGPRRGAALNELGIIPDGAVLISDGIIRQVGTSRRVEALAEARQADDISAAGRVVMPGFVDSHAHVVAGPARPSEFWSREQCPETFWKPLQQTSRHTMEAQGMRLLEDFARHGTTMIEAKSGFGMTETGELKILRTHASLNRRTAMVASTFMGTRWLPPGTSTEDYIDWMCTRMLPLIKRRGLAEFADIYCDRGVFSVEQARRYISAAKQLGFGLKMHAGVTANIGVVPEAVRFGADGISHAVFLNEADIKILSASNTIATLLPGPVFFTRTGHYPPARKLIDSGVAIALATNLNPQTCPSQNMQMMLVLACKNMGMTAAEAISAATINGAHSLRRADRVGSLECDKLADLIILGVSDYREMSYNFGINLVDTTIKNGRVLYERSRIEWPAAPVPRR